MLCPAILDPFEGQNFRIAAIIHQGILCPLLCKIMCFLFTPRKFTESTSNNNHQQLEQSSNLSAHSSLSTSTSTTPTKSNNKTTANGNHKNLVNSTINMDKSDMIVNAISRDKKNCAASDLFLSKDVKID